MSALRLCRDWRPRESQCAEFFTYGPSKLITVYDGDTHVPALLIGRTLALKIDRAMHAFHGHTELSVEEGKLKDEIVVKKSKAETTIEELGDEIKRLKKRIKANHDNGGEHSAHLSKLKAKKKKTEAKVREMDICYHKSRKMIESSAAVSEGKWMGIAKDMDEIWRKGGFIDTDHLKAPPIQPELLHQARHHLQSLHKSVTKAKRAFEAHVKNTSGQLSFDGLRLRESLRIAEEEYKTHYEQWLQLGLSEREFASVGMETGSEDSDYNLEHVPNPPAGDGGHGSEQRVPERPQDSRHRPRPNIDDARYLAQQHSRRSNSQDGQQQDEHVQGNHRQSDSNIERGLRNLPALERDITEWSHTSYATTEESNIEPLSSSPPIVSVPAFGVPATFSAIARPAQRDVLPVTSSIDTNDNQRPQAAPRPGSNLTSIQSHSQASSFEPTNRLNNSAQKRKASGTRENDDEPTHKRQRLPSHDPPSSIHTRRRPSIPPLRERVLERRDSRSPNSSDGLRFPSRTRKSRVPFPISPFQFSYRRQDRNGTREASSQPGTTSQHRGTARGQRIQKETSAERQQRNPLRTLHEDDELSTAREHHVEKRTSVERQQRSLSPMLPRDVIRGMAQGQRAEKYTSVPRNSSVERQKRNPPRSLPEDDADML